ncbi:hypothetical protein CRG98_010515 [Punica granatum]|uniref:Uncharacterized protein n=1 Tax=Punica granatum TaxID=22663 RepID=A0A2I0KMK8_PUNGR|nr:hypothetical protein CRG98_010515 [Punica granatum]
MVWKEGGAGHKISSLSPAFFDSELAKGRFFLCTQDSWLHIPSAMYNLEGNGDRKDYLSAGID